MTFSDFWTNKNNPKLSNYLYNTRHILFLVGTVIAIVILSLIFRKKSEKSKRILFYVLGSILLLFEISSRVVKFIVEENLTFEKAVKIILPMHICSVMVWVFIVAIFTNNKVLKNFACVGGLLATIVFLLYPSVGLNRVYMTFDCLYSTLSHCVGFVCSILMLTLKRTDFDIKKMWQTYACFGAMFSWGGGA